VRILVADGAGYIGPALVPKFLDRRYEVDLQKDASYVLFLNNHTITDHEFVDQFMRVAESEKETGMA